MSSVLSTVLFAIFAFGVIGLVLVGAFVLDRRRAKAVQRAVPERIEGAEDPRRPSAGDAGRRGE